MMLKDLEKLFKAYQVLLSTLNEIDDYDSDIGACITALYNEIMRQVSNELLAQWKAEHQ
jgi:hypothetical protein